MKQSRAPRAEPAIRNWIVPPARDPRWAFAGLLALYAVLGCTVLGFNRSPLQILLTLAASCGLDVLLGWVLHRRLVLPLSACITGLSLSLLLNYAHDPLLLFLPVFLAIGSKYVVTYHGRHFFNPSLFGIAATLLLADHLISPAPAYQWGGSVAVSAFIVMAAVVVFVSRIGRNPLILSFLGFYTLQTALRAYLMRWHLPPETLFVGTLSSAPLFLFTFYMLTDPKTSPDKPRDQVRLAFAITVLDLLLHRQQSLYTFYYAAFFVGLARFTLLHLQELRRHGFRFRERGWSSLRPLTVVGTIGLAGGWLYSGVLRPRAVVMHPAFHLAEIPASRSGITYRPGDTLDRVDARVRHIAKWILANGDSVSAGDFDNDGFPDLFVTSPLAVPQDRAVLYRNCGGFHFERVRIPCLDRVVQDPARYGLITGALFVDYDNDGDQDLFLTVAFGRCILLRNLLTETGTARFVDVSREAGINDYTVSLGAQWLDWDRDGRPDLVIANTMTPYLPDYPRPTPFSLFHLPPAEYPGDRRPFHFMHDSWYNATNGGLKVLYQNDGGHFRRLDNRHWGMPETHWSLALGTADLNHDGWTDLYAANDFGPDDVYLNDHGRGFRRLHGSFTGSIGRDTYKGMNVSIGDLDRDGQPAIYVSNVHEPLQAEGSLLWKVRPAAPPRSSFVGQMSSWLTFLERPPGASFPRIGGQEAVSSPRIGGQGARLVVPEFSDEAAFRGVLNESRFGWGAAMGDLDNDGWIDILQANGMVDDTPDRLYPECPDYWYVNEKVMRAGPALHSYADRWGDLRGRCIFGHEANRVYLNRGIGARPQFIDAAGQVGWTGKTSSRGIALADFDNDGALDVAVTHPFAALSLYRNTLNDHPSAGTRRHWIGFQVTGDGVTCSRDALGSVVTVTYLENGRPVRQTQEIRAANGFSAQDDRRVHFGLGACAGPLRLRVDWYGGRSQEWRGLRPDRYYRVSTHGVLQSLPTVQRQVYPGAK